MTTTQQLDDDQLELFAADAALAAQEKTHAELLQALRAELARLPAADPTTGAGVSADDARPFLERWKLNENGGRKKNYLGCLFRAKGWRREGEKKSTTPGSHGNRIGLYVYDDDGSA